VNRNDDTALFAFVYLGGPLTYVLARLLPELVFYVLPLLLISLILGAAWTRGCHVGGTEYQRVAAFMALSLLLHQSLLQSSKVQALDPLLFHAFNDLKAAIEGAINGSFLRHFRFVLEPALPPLVYRPERYGIRELGLLAWWSIVLGAPAVFFFFARRDDQSRLRAFEARTLEAEMSERETRMRLEGRVYRLERSVDQRDETIAELRAKLPPEPDHPNGEAPKQDLFDTDTF
jgi:hypothetical protein